MIYIATVHWKDDRWIKVQREFMERYIDAPFQVYAYLTDISPEFQGFFNHIRDQDDPSHAEKLNLLASDIMLASKDPTDLILFMDGDAFPIAPILEKIQQYLVSYPLIAIKRLENSGDIQPHPSFCATTTGFWKRYLPGWESGFMWKNAVGQYTTDVGAGILEVLLQNSLTWKPLLRSNVHDLHPVLFGIYDSLIYHHGAGFREGELVRRDFYRVGPVKYGKIGRFVIRLIPQKYKRIVRDAFLKRASRKKNKLVKENTALSQEVYHSLRTTPDEFLSTLLQHKPS